MDEIKTKKPLWKKWWCWVILTFILIIILSLDGGENKKQNQEINPSLGQKNTQEQQPTESPDQLEQLKEDRPVDRINSIVKSVGDFEITVWDLDANFATNDTLPPYEVIVNTSQNDIENCFAAKYTLRQLMEKLYTDEIVGDNIARVMFSAWGYLKSSLGANDANLKWEDVGPSNYWTVTLQYKSYEDESGPLQQRTWGVNINNCK